MNKGLLTENKVEIKVKNDSNFLELAILLDKPEFLSLLPQLRKDYNIENLRDIDEFYKHVNSFIMHPIPLSVCPDLISFVCSRLVVTQPFISFIKSSSNLHGRF